MKPINCVYPKCLECTLPDCEYEEIENKDILESETLDKEIIYERNRQEAIEKGNLKYFKYNHSEKGKAARKKYYNSQKGKAAIKRYQEKNKKNIITTMWIIRNWLDVRGKKYKYDADKNVLKIDRYKVKVLGKIYVVGKQNFESQKDVINNFLIPHYGGGYKEFKK